MLTREKLLDNEANNCLQGEHWQEIRLTGTDCGMQKVLK
jgi:hypothetical protein